MVWTIKFEERAKKELKKLGRSAAKEILNYFLERIVSMEDPRTLGAPLRYEWAGYWKYRIGDYRAICRIEQDTVMVLVLRVGHRKDVYER